MDMHFDEDIDDLVSLRSDSAHHHRNTQQTSILPSRLLCHSSAGYQLARQLVTPQSLPTLCPGPAPISQLRKNRVRESV